MIAKVRVYFPTIVTTRDSRKKFSDDTTETIDEMENGYETTRDETRDESCLFVMGMTKFWEVPIHVRLKDLRLSMCCNKCSNLREVFQADLSRKIMKGVVSRDFMDPPCNCNSASKIDGKCACGGDCRKMCVAYTK